MHRSWALGIASTVKALARLGRNIVTISQKSGGPYPKNSVVKSLLGDSQMVWTMERVKARKAEAKVKRAVAKVEVIK